MPDKLSPFRGFSPSVKQIHSLVKWKNNSCYFDGIYEYFFGLSLRKPYIFRETSWNQKGTIMAFLKSFQERTGSGNHDTNLKTQILRNVICPKYSIEYGEFGHADWIDAVLEEERQEAMLSFCYSSMKRCLECRATDNILFYPTDETFKNIDPENICQSCQKIIYAKPPHLLLLNVALFSSFQCPLPEFIVLLGSRYTLSFVMEAQSREGRHFFYKMLWKNDFPIDYDSLLDYKQSIPYIPDRKWPKHFQHPSLVIYEKGKRFIYFKL